MEGVTGLEGEGGRGGERGGDRGERCPWIFREEEDYFDS